MAHQYGNGSALTRGEFIAHMGRVDQTLTTIDERLDRIEQRLGRPTHVLSFVFGTIGGRILVVLSTAASAYLAARLGFGDILGF